MSRAAAIPHPRTYLSDSAGHLAIHEFARALHEMKIHAPEIAPALVDADGARIELPPAVYEVMDLVISALDSGMGVSIAPLNALLTTQEAADYLGVSRPTVVRMLERGDLPMEKPGRHRYVRLRDLVEFQEKRRVDRRATLDEMQRQGYEDGIYQATDGPPPRTR